MVAVALDTHAFVKRLKAAGMPEEQAEVIINGFSDRRDAELENLATKEDVATLQTNLRETEASLKAKIDKVEARFKSEALCF